MRHRLEYAIVWFFIKVVGLLPRPLARAKGITLALVVYLLHGKLRRVGMTFPYNHTFTAETRRKERGEGQKQTQFGRLLR